MNPVPKIDTQKAVETIAQWAGSFTEMIITQGSRADICGLLYDAIRDETLSLGDAVAGAVGGDPYLDRALRQVASEYMASGFIPPDLCEFIDHVLRASGPPNFPKGRHAYNSRNRNTVIKVLVEQTRMTWGVDKVRSEATAREKPCACSMVAEAMALLDFEITEERVAQIAGAG